MAILYYRNQMIMLLARLNFGLTSENKEEIIFIITIKKILIQQKILKILPKYFDSNSLI